MNKPIHNRALRTRERGVTLIELMIAMLIALILTAGIIQIFVGNRATYAFNEGLSRVQENARFALDYVANDARMAGYMGCLSTLGVNNALKTPDAFRDDLEGGLMGYDAAGTAAGESFEAGAVNPAVQADETKWSPTLPAALADRAIAGSDVLVVRRVGAQTNTLVPPFSTNAELYTAQPDVYLKGQILVVTDCLKATIFQVTNDPQAVGEVTLEHDASALTPGNLAATWPVELSYGLGSEVAPLQVTAFFVGVGAGGSPSLYQQRLRRQSDTVTGWDPPEELVDNIDTLQLRYGHDDDNDGTIDEWLTADEVAGTDWPNIASLEISLIARAAEEYGTTLDESTYQLGGMEFTPEPDRRIRRAFSTVVALRNRLP